MSSARHAPARRAASERRRAPVRIELRCRVAGWLPPRRELSRWASAAVGRRAGERALGVYLVGARESARLNAHFRGRDRATNVLSFAAAPLPRDAGAVPRTLGELVICPRVLLEEARAQDKSLRAHWAHLVVHGTLHLLGYDHQRRREARRMERREIAVLKRLGFANPYRSSS